MDRRFTDRWNLRLPVIQAPMGGGPTTPQLAAAVCNAGGMGSVAAAYLSPEQIDRELGAVRKLTDRPFAVNLFSRDPDRPLGGDVEAMTRWLATQHEQLGIDAPKVPTRAQEDFDQQLDAILAHPVAVLSFTFGLIPEARMVQLKSRGVYVIGTATTVREAQALEAAGCDAVVAQGSEAGAHRGTFLSAAQNALIGTIALVPQAVDAVKLPVIASGGIMDGRGIIAARVLGAAAVQMGTAFLTCDEAGTNAAHRQAVLKASEDLTVITDSFSGRAARGLRNGYIEQFSEARLQPLSYPWQNAMTRDLRRAAAAQNDPDHLALWAGQGVRMARSQSASDLMRELEKQMVLAATSATR